MHPSRKFARDTYPRQQRGQALSEFTIAAAFVLVPLFLMIPLLGKFIDMKSSTIQAARYAAWERTVWHGNSDWAVDEKSDADIQSEVQKRFFADTSAEPLRSSDKTSTLVNDIKPLWHDQSGASLLSSYSTEVGTGTQTPGTLQNFLDKLMSVVNTVGDVLGANFRLDMKSLYTSKVNLNTANTSAINRTTGGTNSGFLAPNFVANQVLVANGWSANGPEFVKKQTEGLTPLSLAQRDPIKGVMNFFQDIAGKFIEELGSDSLKLGGVILPDYVPPDRLAAAPAATPSSKQTAKQRREEATQKHLDEGTAQQKRLEAKSNKFNSSVRDTQNFINYCKEEKQKESDFNHGCKSLWPSYRKVCDDSKLPPGGLGTSYTPVADASVECHQGLDDRITDLQTQLNDPDFQSAKTKFDENLIQHPELAKDAEFMKRRAEAQKALDDLQNQIDDLKRQKNAI